MDNNVDPELNAYLNLDLPAEDLEGGDDAYDEFFQASKLAGALGWPAAEGIARETARIEKSIHRRDTAPAPSNDPQRLAKREETISFYVNWLGEQMEKTSKPSDEIIAQWRSDFPDARAEIVDAIEAAQLIVDGVN